MKPSPKRLEANIAGEGFFRIGLANGRISSTERMGDEISGAPYCAPGFVDLQINGLCGVDFQAPDLEPGTLVGVLPAIWASGVTSFCPTLITNTLEGLERNFRVLEAARKSFPRFAASAPGYHLEGPYLSPGPSHGAHEPALMRSADPGEFERLQRAAGGRILILTLAPERPGAQELIRRMAERGVAVALGHTDGTADDIHQAAAGGAVLNTHLGNGCPQLIDRHRAPFWAQLADERLVSGMICDGFHLPPELVQVIYRTKGPERCFLVTDAIHIGHLPPGRYSLLGRAIDLLTNGQVVAADGRSLAGSTKTMEHCIATFLRMTGASLAEAVRAAASVPARFLPAGAACRRVAPGEPANLVVFHFQDGTLKIERTLLQGETVHGPGS